MTWNSPNPDSAQAKVKVGMAFKDQQAPNAAKK